MDQFNLKNYAIYANFLNKLTKDLTILEYKKSINDTEVQTNRIQ